MFYFYKSDSNLLLLYKLKDTDFKQDLMLNICL